jgi:nucleoside transport protein
MKFLIAILGLLIVFGLALLASSDRKKVKVKPIILMVIMQLILTYLLLNTKFGLVIINAIANAFAKLLDWANEGITFVFGGIVNEGASTFFLNVLLPIVFISALIGILQHFKILPFVMKWIGYLLSKVNGMGKLESYNAVASAIVGQTEVFITL